MELLETQNPLQIAACKGFWVYLVLGETINWWRRGELNPRPQIRCLKALHAYSIFCLTRIPPIDRLACRLFQFGFSTLALNKRKRDLMLDDAWNPNA